MDPQIKAMFATISGQLLKSEITGPIDEIKFEIYLIFHQDWKIIVAFISVIVVKILWPYITGKHRTGF